MVAVLQKRLWTLLGIAFSVFVGVVNRVYPVPNIKYFDEVPSLSRDIVYARRMGGLPLPDWLIVGLLLVGVTCFIVGRMKTPYFRLLNVVGFLAIVGAWTPNVAITIGVLFGFLLLGWIMRGMGTQSSAQRSILDLGQNTADDYRGFWYSVTSSSSRLYRTHVLRSFGICWVLALGMFGLYFSGPGGWLINFPHSYSDPVPTSLYAMVLVVAPIFLAALFELIREPELPTVSL